MEVKAINEAGAMAGDRIVLLFETASLLKATFLLYVFPILLLIIGAAIGQGIAPHIGFNSSGLAALTGFSFFIAAVLVIKVRANKMALKKEYRPKIIKILARGADRQDQPPSPPSRQPRTPTWPQTNHHPNPQWWWRSTHHR